jgi:hypothetical protein
MTANIPLRLGGPTVPLAFLSEHLRSGSFSIRETFRECKKLGKTALVIGHRFASNGYW